VKKKNIVIGLIIIIIAYMLFKGGALSIHGNQGITPKIVTGGGSFNGSGASYYVK
jgi:hypothetical protein